LARYLIELAIKYPLTIGHTLFWGFKSEIYNPNVRQRFGLYLEVFLSKIGKDIHMIFENEIFLIKALLNAADIPHDKSIKNEALKLQRFRDQLEKINQEIYNRNIEISLPLNFKLRVKNFIVEKCKTMKSKKKPLWLVFKNADENGEDIVVMFKKGDDLRQDILTLQLFRIMHNLWFDNKIKVKMSLYKVICTGYYQGMLEIVKDSVTLAQVHKLYGGAFASLTQKPLKNWMDSHCTNTQEEYRNNFLESCIAYCMATWVLGVGDRHNDNIMIKKVIKYFILIERRIVSY
jgi:Phosphatidylinositol 3- and 4-kinase